MFKKTIIASCLSILLASCGGGGGSNNAIEPITPTPIGLHWVETDNSVEVPFEIIGTYRSRNGFGSVNLYDYSTKSFIFTSGGEYLTPRSPTDGDFLTLSFTNSNKIFIDKNPISFKYIAGFVNEILNIGNTLVMVDQGRESRILPIDQFENSYLWKLEKQNGTWQVKEFGQEFGKQFWHGGDANKDINNDGQTDFVVSNISLRKQEYQLILFLSTNNDYNKLDLTSSICKESSDSNTDSASSSLIKLANGNYGVISLPYMAKLPWNSARLGTILEIDTSGKVISKQCLPVRNTPDTVNLSTEEGYNQIRVLDINNDGLDDFVAIAEHNAGEILKTKKLLAVIQNQDKTFKVANLEYNIPFEYGLSNRTNEPFNDWVTNSFQITNVFRNDLKEIFFKTDLIRFSQLQTYGIRGCINLLEKISCDIPAKSLIWNKEIKPFDYRYIIPTEINNDGKVDFLLVALFRDSKYISSTNLDGSYYKISALLSKK